MPELPEVQTTVDGLSKTIQGLRITAAWSDYDSDYFKGSETIKDAAYLPHFKKNTIGSRVISIERRAKNILINLSNNQTILVHMKMTGHLLYGNYEFKAGKKKDPWQPISPPPLLDPYNRHIHFVLTFNNGKRLALSDLRKFAKVAVVHSKTIHSSSHLKDIGPEPLEKAFTFKAFKERLMLRKKWKIKQALMDQSVMAGIGNIYADESLWRSSIHPAEIVGRLKDAQLKGLYSAIRKTLSRSIDFGGDSMSDYRNVHGEKGTFQEEHHAYQRTGMRCELKGCNGTIRRIVIGGRGTHYCDRHQRLDK
ncbi:MAG: bifunctional DNA-formamidopyrimidine glycosylase/DNA-(apurinic or apyrimidinic site) lyase [Candidatus Taylorbacteria bacterium]|nr:bifunctional DNA-formamidopyrimidine glycosylase/DNA-(apurinic or apyrimidinic site) lyase [Candidatus Taylorbacteria bacterium]